MCVMEQGSHQMIRVLRVAAAGIAVAARVAVAAGAAAPPASGVSSDSPLGTSTVHKLTLRSNNTSLTQLKRF